MNSSDFATKFSLDEKQALRLIRECPRSVEMTMDTQCVHQGQADQFYDDCLKYGLYEASLYAINAVRSGHCLESIGQELEKDLRHLLDKKSSPVKRKPRVSKPSKYNLDDLI